MAEPFLGELRLMSFTFAPKGWAQCNGQLLPINQNQALFSLLGTTYGGDGRVNFALPDLRGRVPIHMGNGWTQGQRAGEEAHTLTQSEMPAHQHFVNASASDGNTVAPTGNILAGASNLYATNLGNLTTHEPNTIKPVGGSQAHLNLHPFLALEWCIALQGIFPSRN
jgi:microcystin-dependent protein